jgi:hypothetical protein
VCPLAKQEFFLTAAGSNAFGKIGYGLMVIYVAGECNKSEWLNLITISSFWKEKRML